MQELGQILLGISNSEQYPVGSLGQLLGGFIIIFDWRVHILSRLNARMNHVFQQ